MRSSAERPAGIGSSLFSNTLATEMTHEQKEELAT